MSYFTLLGTRFGSGSITSFPLHATDGSASAPSYSFENSPTTGLYRFGTGVLGITAGGIATATFSNSSGPILQLRNTSAQGSFIVNGVADGFMSISASTGSGSGANILMYGNTHASTPNLMQFFRGPTLTMELDNSGRIGLAGSVSTSVQVQIRGTGTVGVDQAGISASAWSANSDATASVQGILSGPTTAAASFNTAFLSAFSAANVALGAGATATRHIMYWGAVPTRGTNNAWASDNTTWTSDWLFHFTTTRRSFLTGALALSRFDVASAATITALDSTRSFVKLTGATATTIQGITAGVDGQRLVIVNLTGSNMTIANENAGATAANRITTMTGADVVTTGNGSAELVYDTGSSRWICLYVTA